MSASSIDDLSTTNLSESSSENNTRVRTSLDRFLQKKIQALTAEDILSSVQSVKMKISPTSTAVNSIDGKIELTAELEDVETSNKSLSTGGSDSFTSHTLPIYGKKSSSAPNKILEPQLSGDLYLPLAEEQDTDTNTRKNINATTAKGFASNEGSAENSISAILAFKEVFQNQCDLLNAQTNAIHRLATAIEDQNLMISRLHNVVHRSDTKNLPDSDETSKKYASNY